MKIALCFSGQPRSYEKGYEYYKKNLLDHYDVDVFIHTWDTDDMDWFGYVSLYKTGHYQIHPAIAIHVRSHHIAGILG